MEPILPGAPWLIAHKSILGVNKPNKITLNGQDYVIWQNQKLDCQMKRLCSMQKDSTASGNLDLQNLTTFYN